MHLRVLVANQVAERLDRLTATVTRLGHEVIARQLDVGEIAEMTAIEHPDVALVGLGESSDHALALISEIVQEAACPVIVVLHDFDSAFVAEAAKRGIFAHVSDREEGGLEGSIEIVLRRFADYHNLEGAFGRRATIERAKGILMERSGIDERQAFELLRSHARSGNRKLLEVADAVVEGHQLLPKQAAS